MPVRRAGNGIVDFERFGFGDLRRSEAARCSDDEPRCPFIGAEGVVCGSEDLRDGSLTAEVFGWASSFCWLSNWIAARLLLNDLRRRLPLASRQSAKYFWPF
jgi:hypothetical protein